MTAIVVVEDEPDIADLLALYCRREGWTVHLSTDGRHGLETIRSRNPDFVVLDVGLPGELDGFDVCRELRRSSQVPVLFLTARDDEIDRILGLEMGADDYVTKPFSPREIVARIKAVLRRGRGPAADTRADYGPISVDRERREVTNDGNPVPLATQEWALLAALVDNEGIALSRQQLLDLAWGSDWIGDPRTVDVHVRQLRRKLATTSRWPRSGASATGWGEMQRRLTIALVLTALLSILLVGFGVLAIAQAGARNRAEDEVTRSLSVVGSLLGSDGRQVRQLEELVPANRRDLRLDQLITVVVADDGSVRTITRRGRSLPSPGAELSDQRLTPEQLTELDQGETIVGSEGNTVFGLRAIPSPEFSNGDARLALLARQRVTAVPRQTVAWFLLSSLIVVVGALLAGVLFLLLFKWKEVNNFLLDF